MRAIHSALCAAAVLLAATSPAFGQNAPPAADLTGAWTLQATFVLPMPVNPESTTGMDAENGGPMCGYEGTANLTQDGQGGVAGTASLGLIAGDTPPCPAEMSGMLTGTLAGTMLTGTLTDPNLGEAAFDGSLNPQMAKTQGAIAAEAHAGLMLGGNNAVIVGPFAGALGFWNAVAAPSVIEIPTLGLAGLAALVLLLAASAAFLLVRRRTA